MTAARPVKFQIQPRAPCIFQDTQIPSSQGQKAIQRVRWGCRQTATFSRDLAGLCCEALFEPKGDAERCGGAWAAGVL